MKDDRHGTAEPKEDKDMVKGGDMSEDDPLEDIASGRISGCQAFRTLAASVKKSRDDKK